MEAGSRLARGRRGRRILKSEKKQGDGRMDVIRRYDEVPNANECKQNACKWINIQRHAQAKNLRSPFINKCGKRLSQKRYTKVGTQSKLKVKKLYFEKGRNASEGIESDRKRSDNKCKLVG